MRTFILFIGLFVTMSAQAQEAKKYTLKQCIEYAKANQTRIKSSRIDEELQKEKNNEVIGLARPKVSASGQFQYLFIVPKSRIDANAFDFGSSFSFFKIDTPAFIAFQQRPKEKYNEAQFGLPLNASLGVTVSQILFDAGVLVALEARQSLIELTKINTQRTTEEVNIAVSKAYYNCVIAEKRIKLLDDNIALLETIEKTTTRLYAEGFAEKIDADRLTVQKNNLLTERSKVQNLIDLGYAVLKFQMGMDLQTKLTLSDDISIEAVRSGLDIDKVINYENRTEMSLLKTLKKLNQFDYKRHQKSYLPSLVAVVNGSYASQTIAFKELFTLPYFPTGAFVLSASMPLYEGGARRARMNQARLNIMKNDNDILAFKQAVDLEYSNARTQLNNSFISLQNQEKNIELAQKVYNIAQKKYKEGVGSNLEIIQADTALKEAQTNYYNSLFEAMMAKIDFNKSLGLLK